MRLNTIQPAPGSKPSRMRVGRGCGSGKGKTCGLGHKGGKARAGYNARRGFEGGQTPLYRRIPKSGFITKLMLITEQVPLQALQKLPVDVVNIDALHEHNVIKTNTKRAKIFLSGTIDRAITISGIRVTAGARQAIEKAGGKVE